LPEDELTFDMIIHRQQYLMCSPRGEMMRTMCGLRTGGWSRPFLMSDWQRCVDWFLAKYCRCRLRLDWCWCRWRTSAKGRHRWGLQVASGVKCGPRDGMNNKMKSWTVSWLRLKTKVEPDVGAESWVEIGGGYTEFAGFPVVQQKTTGFLGWSTKPRPKNRRRCCSSARPV
jgi:hypothetical protein